jgi:DNA-binding protein YbaB
LAVNFAGDPDEEIDADDSGVRMVQLFFDGESHMKFLEVVAILKERYGSETLTDTVLHGLTDAADNS